MTPLVQDYWIATRVPETGRYYIHDPGIVRLPSGGLLVAAPCLERATDDWHGVRSWQTFLSRSLDGGKTWTPLPTLPYSDATPFVHEGVTYMFVQPAKWENVSLVKSLDEGETWSQPVLLFQGSYWNCHTGMVIHQNRLYWALNSGGYQGGTVVIAGDLGQDLLSSSAWRMSSEAPKPSTPREVVRGMYPVMLPEWEQWPDDSWLEPNVVLVQGQIRVMSRTVLDGYATAGLAAVCDLSEDGGKMDLRFTQFYPMPGGQNKFFILHDEKSGLFWMTANLPADSQGVVFQWDRIRENKRFAGGPGNDRRFLMLSYSVDALNWFPAGCIANTRDPHQSFMYPAALVDGEDLVVLSRTSVNGRDQHDADLATVHRVRGFRDLAMDLFPR